MDKALELKDKIDNLYNDVRNDVQGGISKLDKLFVEVLSLEDLSGYNEEEKQQIKELINSLIDNVPNNISFSKQLKRYKRWPFIFAYMYDEIRYLKQNKHRR